MNKFVCFVALSIAGLSAMIFPPAIHHSPDASAQVIHPINPPIAFPEIPLLPQLAFAQNPPPVVVDPKKPNPNFKIIILKNGQRVVLVPRNQLRVKKMKPMRVPLVHAEKIKLPVVPAGTIDWTMGGKIPLPILGNDQKGDCFAAAAAHEFTMLSANAAQDPTKGDVFDLNTLLTWYAQASGGDNGLSDSDVIPAIEAGFIPPSGTHKVLDTLLVDVTSISTMRAALYYFGPAMWTCTLNSEWENETAPGAIWGTGTQDPNAGHAMVMASMAVDGQFSTETWAIQPAIQVTNAGFNQSGPEMISCFSLEWFNSSGYAPNGLYYTEVAAAWVAMGGKQLPASPFPAPGPTPVPPTPTPIPPIPPVPSGTTVVIDPVAKTVSVPTGWTVVGVPTGFGQSIPALQADLTAKQISPALIAAIIKLVEELLGLAPVQGPGKKLGKADSGIESHCGTMRVDSDNFWLFSAYSYRLDFSLPKIGAHAKAQAQASNGKQVIVIGEVSQKNEYMQTILVHTVKVVDELIPFPKDLKSPVNKEPCIAPCKCGCVDGKGCLCQSCDKHTADPKSPDFVFPKK